MRSFTWKPDEVSLGNLKVKDDGLVHEYLTLLTGKLTKVKPPFPKRAFGPVTLKRGIGDDTAVRRIGFIVPDDAAFFLASDVDFVPDGNP